MSMYEASLKMTDPTTGNTHLNRLMTMRAPSPDHVRNRVIAMGLTTDREGELIVYRF